LITDFIRDEPTPTFAFLCLIFLVFIIR
jgi:hypothetical protein